MTSPGPFGRARSRQVQSVAGSAGSAIHSALPAVTVTLLPAVMVPETVTSFDGENPAVGEVIANGAGAIEGGAVSAQAAALPPPSMTAARTVAASIRAPRIPARRSPGRTECRERGRGCVVTGLKSNERMRAEPAIGARHGEYPPKG